MKELNNLESKYISVLLEKQVKKIISENNEKDPYFTIRENFDVDQFVWDIAVYLYKSSGYNIELVKTKQLILKHQSLAVELYQKEQEKARLENLRIQAEQKRIRLRNSKVEKERIQIEIKNLENEQQKVSGQYFSEIQVLQKISNLQQQEIDILKEEEENVLQQIQMAERDYDLNRASELRFEKLRILQQQITEKEAKLIEIQSSIQTKMELEQQRITQERIKQEEQEKLLLEQIVPLLESQAELGGSIFKAKVYLCLIRIIAEDFDTDEDCIKWQTNFKIDLEKETYQEYLSRINSSGSWSSGSGGFGLSYFDLSCMDFIMSLEELLEIEITDEESEKCLIDVGILVDYIISRFQDNPEKLENCVTKYILDNIK